MLEERSVNIKPKAAASGTVRNERRKLLAWHGTVATEKENKNIKCKIATENKIYFTINEIYYIVHRKRYRSNNKLLEK